MGFTKRVHVVLICSLVVPCSGAQGPQAALQNCEAALNAEHGGVLTWVS